MTGAASGTGRLIALALAELGARVAVADIDGEGAARVSSQIVERGGVARAVRADVCDEDDVASIVAQAGDLGAVHILVNNAGGWGTAGRQFPDATPAEWGAVLDLNLRAPMSLTQRCLPSMARDRRGAVVNIASSAALDGGAYGSPEYGAAKAGLVRFSTALADLRERSGVRVNCIVPHWIGLERAHAELAQMTPEQRAGAPPTVPPQTVAAATVAFIRDESLAGRVMVLAGGEEPELLDPAADQLSG